MSRNLGKWLMTLGISFILLGTILGVYGYLQTYNRGGYIVDPAFRTTTVFLTKSGVQVEVYLNHSFYDADGGFGLGPAEPGSTFERLIRVQNIENTSATLTFQTEFFYYPQFQKDFNLSWNYSGQTLQPNQTIPILLTLTISPDFPNTMTIYAFTLVITAVKQQA